MITTKQITENFDRSTIPFYALQLTCAVLEKVADGMDAVADAAPGVLAASADVALVVGRWLWTALCWLVTMLPTIAKALVLTAAPVLGMIAVLVFWAVIVQVAAAVGLIAIFAYVTFPKGK